MDSNGEKISNYVGLKNSFSFLRKMLLIEMQPKFGFVMVKRSKIGLLRSLAIKISRDIMTLSTTSPSRIWIYNRLTEIVKTLPISKQKFLPSGTYTDTENLTIPKPISIPVIDIGISLIDHNIF